MSIIAKHFLVSGRVQGVGFRYFVLNAARHLGVYGWVRNLPDGSVEAWAEGTTDAIEAFQNELNIGPSYAHVTRLHATPGTPTHRYTTFYIDR